MIEHDKTDDAIVLAFDKGTLILTKVAQPLALELPGVQWDERTAELRAPAIFYREIVLTLRQKRIAFVDQARQFQPCDFQLKQAIVPRDYQAEAVEAWLACGSRGVIALPTGAGKTIVALLLIARTSRPTLIHVPTIDLMQQWQTVLKKYFDVPIGLLGGGEHSIHSITVATYDSALIHVTQKGAQFGLIIFDECHHLPGDQYQYLAMAAIAPFRLGLTATPERSDGREQLLYSICGELCYQSHIDELEGKNLAPYTVSTIAVEMDAEEQQCYQVARQCYLDFLRQERISMGQPSGWKTFLWKSSKTPEGRDAFKAYLRQKQLSQAAFAKLEWVWRLLLRHRGERILVFTQDNDMAYRIGSRFFLPVLTHHTRVQERGFFLDAFRAGRYPVLVTSKVLNEGIDVPEANVAIIVSGSGSVREHVQRLGRILRPIQGKQAYCYELVTKGTGETFVNKRRRQHRAYQRSGALPH